VKKHRLTPTLLLAFAATWAPAAGAQTANASSVDTTAWAQQVEALALQAAQAAIADMPEARVEVQAGQLDPRLKLAPCQQVDIYLPAGQRAWGATRIGLRCVGGPGRWNVFMPLTVRVFAPAIQTQTALPAGTVLSAEHLVLQTADWSAANASAYGRMEPVLGRTLTRALPAGATIRENDLKKRQRFAVGDTVRVLAVGQGFSVTSEGTAMTQGFDGEPAKVKTENGRTLTGTVTGDRRMEVRL
jgi:flagellar basal body P-ring formation protein FlgA